MAPRLIPGSAAIAGQWAFSPPDTRVFSNITELFMPDATSYMGGGLGI